ncbi:hypothetical protein ABT269_38590 [Streptomyces viridosporus]|uniref:hypothetical protein n=1 Tax=Streptomyces viridosporus TaxID=67581 RepID=UPI00332AE904
MSRIEPTPEPSRAPSRRTLFGRSAILIAGATLGIGNPTPAQAADGCGEPPTEVSPEALQHARDFVQATAEAGTTPDSNDRDQIFEAGKDFIVPALQSEGAERDFLIEVSQVTKRIFADHALKTFYEGDNPQFRVLGLDRPWSVAAASLYARAARELADPEWGPVLRDALRAPGQYLDAAREVFAELERDFQDGLLQATCERYSEDATFSTFVDRGAEDLQSLEQELRELGLTGDGREGSFIIVGSSSGLTIVCSLTLPACIALAILVGIIVIAIIVVTATSRK